MKRILEESTVKVMFTVVLMWDAVIEFSSFFCNPYYGLATLTMALFHNHSCPVSSEVTHSSLMIVITNLDTGGHHLHRRVEYRIQASKKSNLKQISQLNFSEVREPSIIDNALAIMHVCGDCREVVFPNNRLFNWGVVTGKEEYLNLVFVSPKQFCRIRKCKLYEPTMQRRSQELV